MDIFVGNLPFKIKEEELKELFGKYGKVDDVNLIIDKRIGQPKGYGFVVMKVEKEALAAINALNGIELMERVIKVSQSEGNKEGSGKDKSIRKTSGTTKQGFFKSKSKAIKEPPIVTYGDPEKKMEKKKKGGVKLAKNFKVGKRKKS